MQGLRRKGHILWWLLFASGGALIVWLSLTPSPPLIKTFLLGWDKLQHAAAYGVFTFLGGRAFDSVRIMSSYRWRWAFFAAVLLGMVTEITQRAFTLHRVAEWGDLAANIAGAGLVYFAAVMDELRTRLEKLEKSQGDQK